MLEFAGRTGLSTNGNSPRRYLWTDAYAVCNFLGLHRQTGDRAYLDLALSLVDQVHHILGRYSDNDSRCGWISGLDDEAGEAHPTRGGLRIGKKLAERGPDEPYDERLEWDRDGQYFHYLTKWMHALCRAGMVTGDRQYCCWAVELAQAAHAGFAAAAGPGGQMRLFWKMSIDLSYPLVPSMGHHDPLDGLITYNELRTCALPESGQPAGHDLDKEITETGVMIEDQQWQTSDALGMGGLLYDACRVLQITAAEYLQVPVITDDLVRAAKASLDAYAAQLPLNHPAEYRLAFRELGLTIGLRAVANMQIIVNRQPALFSDNLKQDLEGLKQYLPLIEVIESFWRNAGNHLVSSWRDHRDINTVMLATSLLPDGFLSLDLNEQGQENHYGEYQ